IAFVNRNLGGRDGLAISVVDRVEDFEASAPAWDDMVRRAHGTPFMLAPYIASAWRHHRGDALCVFVHRGEKLIGGLPVAIEHRFGARKAVLLCGAHRTDLVVDRDEPAATSSA